MIAMSNYENKSDLGFIVFLGLAIIILVPIGMGFNSFDQLLKIGKIILIVICIAAVSTCVIFSYLYIRKKTKSNNKKIEEREKGKEYQVEEKKNGENKK